MLPLGMQRMQEMTGVELAIVTAVLVVVAAALRLYMCLRPRSRRTVKLKSSEKCSTLMVLGSGGHTTEMLALVEKMSERYEPLHVVMADTDKTSMPKFEACSPALASRASVYKIRRSREVGQSYVTSAWSTAAATLDSVAVVLRSKPRLVLCNGPGTCVPVCIGALLLRFFGMGDPCIVFVESFCRVKTLSLTGKILYGIADRFLVQWPELADQFPRAEYVGTLF